MNECEYGMTQLSDHRDVSLRLSTPLWNSDPRLSIATIEHVSGLPNMVENDHRVQLLADPCVANSTACGKTNMIGEVSQVVYKSTYTKGMYVCLRENGRGS